MPEQILSPDELTGEAARLAALLPAGRLKQVVLEPADTDPLDHTQEFFAFTEVGEGSYTLSAKGRRGLLYGLRELLKYDGAGKPTSWREWRRSLRVRSVAYYPQNRQIDDAWIHDRGYWEAWFQLLTQARLNMFSFVFAHQTGYLAPPYPFLLKLQGWEQVTTSGWSEADRERWLATLQMIGEIAADHGIVFTLGIWQQCAREQDANLVEGLAYDDLFAYCPEALAALLAAVPTIGGLQLRMNSESGIAEDDQQRFYTGLLTAAKACGRPLWLDLRAKGLRAETIAAVNALGYDLTVSTKFWTEHMGMPYPQSRINPLDEPQYRRYGYWDLLRRDRPYKVLYRLWTVGTQRVLPWGDYDYAREFAGNCARFGGDGFEICAPESNKGYGNLPGGSWNVVDPENEGWFTYPFQRYWAFLLVFGLGANDHDCDYTRPAEEHWDMACDEHFAYDGDDWDRLEHYIIDYLQNASRILPLVTAAHAASASTFGSWIELYTGGLSDAYARIGSGDIDRIVSIHDFVDHLFAPSPDARTTPIEIADELTRLVPRRDGFKNASIDPANLELVSLRRDLTIISQLGIYHAARHCSAVAWLVFRRSGDMAWLEATVDHYQQALTAWRQVVELTEGVYYRHMLFNQPGRQVGHWADELPWLEQELTRLQTVRELWLAAQTNPEPFRQAEIAHPWYQYPLCYREENGTIIHYQGEKEPAEALTYPQYGLPEMYVVEEPASIVKDLLTKPLVTAPDLHTVYGERPKPPELDAWVNCYDGVCGQDLTVGLRLTLEDKCIIFNDLGEDVVEKLGEELGDRLDANDQATPTCGLTAVDLHVRPRNQALPWTVIPMVIDPIYTPEEWEGERPDDYAFWSYWKTTVPATLTSTEFDIELAFIAHFDDGSSQPISFILGDNCTEAHTKTIPMHKPT